MLDNLNYEEYKNAVGTKFAIAGSSIEIELREVSEQKLSGRQELFSLTFAGAKENFLEQKIYRLRHAALGEGEIFLVPIAENAAEFLYEAGFNRLID